LEPKRHGGFGFQFGIVVPIIFLAHLQSASLSESCAQEASKFGIV